MQSLCKKKTIMHHLHYCLGSQMGSFLWILGNLPRARFLHRVIMIPQSRYLFPFSSFLSFLNLNHPIPSSSPPLFSHFLLSPPSLHSASHHTLNFLRSCLFPLLRGSMYIFLRILLVTQISGIIDYRLAFLYNQIDDYLNCHHRTFIQQVMEADAERNS